MRKIVVLHCEILPKTHRWHHILDSPSNFVLKCRMNRFIELFHLPHLQLQDKSSAVSWYMEALSSVYTVFHFCHISMPLIWNLKASIPYTWYMRMCMLHCGVHAFSGPSPPDLFSLGNPVWVVKFRIQPSDSHESLHWKIHFVAYAVAHVKSCSYVYMCSIFCRIHIKPRFHVRSRHYANTTRNGTHVNVQVWFHMCYCNLWMQQPGSVHVAISMNANRMVESWKCMILVLYGSTQSYNAMSHTHSPTANLDLIFNMELSDMFGTCYVWIYEVKLRFHIRSMHNATLW